MKKAVFLDRDGTINVDKHYLYKIEDFELLPGTIEALKIIQEKGFMIIIITNQSGIARGKYSEDDFLKLTSFMIHMFEKEGIRINDVLYCPHLPDAKILDYKIDCDCRKPRLGLFNEAIQKWDIDLSSSFAIGDRLRDCSICLESDCKGYVIGNTVDAETIKKIDEGVYHNIEYRSTLIECALDIR